MKRFSVAAISAVIAIALAFTAAGCDSDSVITLTIDSANEGVAVNPDMYGLFLEDISYAGDGGLVSELVQNGSFEYAPDHCAAWVFDGTEAEIATDDPLNENNTHYLSLSVGEGGGMLGNIGYPEYYDYLTEDYNAALAQTPDMGFDEGGEYVLSFYARGLDGYAGEMSARLGGADGSDLSDTVPIGADDETVSAYDGWSRYEVTLVSEYDRDGGLYLYFGEKGSVELDFVSLVPKDSYGYGSDEWKYVSLREDLYEAIADLNPGFIRFPGGCLAEGDDLSRLFSWKNTIGPLEEREQANNIWRDESIGKSYNNTFALGYHEYLQLCEDLGAEPLPILNVGMICQFEFDPDYRDYEADYLDGKISEADWNAYLDRFALRPGTEEFDAYVGDVLDLIEYCNGSVDTEWGALRAANGHPEPFGLEYIGLGNENWGLVYWRNFDALYNAVKEAYPEITVISSASYQFSGDYIDESWEIINDKYPDTIVDEHYYTSGNKLFQNNDRYDSYDRDGAQVFVGEYAATCWGIGSYVTKNNIWAAVEEAGYLTSLERNGDIVKWASYAPTFAKINAQCWDINLIWFDSQNIVLTPNYYVQLLYSNNTGSVYVETEENADVKTSVTADKGNGVIYVKLVNESSHEREVSLDVSGYGDVNGWSMLYIDGVKAACNEPGSTTVVPQSREGSAENGRIATAVAARSVNVIRIYCGDNDGAALWQLPEIPETMYGTVTEYDKFFVEPETAIALGVTGGVVLVAAAVAVTVVAVRRRRRGKRR